MPRPRGGPADARAEPLAKLLEREVSELGKLLENSVPPAGGGARGQVVSDKIGVIESFEKAADFILIGGGPKFKFLGAAQGRWVGESPCADRRRRAGGPGDRRLLLGGGRATMLAFPVTWYWASTSAPTMTPQPGDGVDVDPTSDGP